MKPLRALLVLVLAVPALASAAPPPWAPAHGHDDAAEATCEPAEGTLGETVAAARADGLRGRALAQAIHAEQACRGHGPSAPHGHGHAGGHGGGQGHGGGHGHAGEHGPDRERGHRR